MDSENYPIRLSGGGGVYAKFGWSLSKVG